MITRYMLLIGETDEAIDAMAERTAQTTGLQLGYRGGRTRALVGPRSSVLALPNNRGVVIGTVFPRFGPNRSVSQNDSAELDRLAACDTHSLLERYWGSYVYCGGPDPALIIMRDPSASLPCYYVAIPGGYVLTSDVKLLVRSGLLKPSIAWEQIPRYLSAKDLPCGLTGLLGVREILAGEALIDRAGRLEPAEAWSPWDHIGDDGASTVDELCEKLRRTVANCVDAWASEGDANLLMLSGGLDSSVVASCLAGANPRLTCMTMISGDGYGDERGYARTMAAAIDADLIEHRYSMSDIDLSQSVAEHVPKPIGSAHERALFVAIARKCNEMGTAAVFTGNGGDNVFYNSSSVRPFFDRAQHGDGWLGAIRTVRDISCVTGVTPTAAARAIVRFWPQVHRRYDWPREVDFLTYEIAEIARSLQLDHAWLRSPRGAPSGKQGHIALLLRMQNHIEGYLRSAGLAMINPLASQPVLELALHIPTWRQIQGGVNRAIVRRAFADKLPESIRERYYKGSPGGFAMAILEKKASEVTERLMEGPLATRGFIDREAVRNALAKGPGMGFGYMRLLAFLDLQAWIEQWGGVASQGYVVPGESTASG
ncbi:asparagine synthase C-terminal domain-containing protein [Sphingobium sp.]|uniref:asparagine synthase C-terminal domain-containing protein n=1 Tax=Sphingobium sp. TaxID=1912891 RepID=UPI0028BF46DD|nr:asparagine synthase C-terminal domain-containing protein [Sphingobium sp.]